MGFGLIFVGYLTILTFKVMPPAMAVGAYLMYRGLKKLSIYGKKFGAAATLSLSLAAYHVLYTLLWFASFAGIAKGVFSSRAFAVCDDVVYYGLLLVFHVFLYGAFEEISKFCGYDKGVKKAYMSRFIMAMFYAFAVINVPLTYFGGNSYITLAFMICELSWLIYTSAYIYGCYMRIATEEIISEEERKIAEYDAKHAYKRKNKSTKK